uniref:Uncharacterized protein n=1 Tax=Aegilops tauschii TaxID=37682 RepID=M8BIL2_AEGTA
MTFFTTVNAWKSILRHVPWHRHDSKASRHALMKLLRPKIRVRSSRGRPELVGVQIKEADMKQINELSKDSRANHLYSSRASSPYATGGRRGEDEPDRRRLRWIRWRLGLKRPASPPPADNELSGRSTQRPPQSAGLE